jgi:4-hydroxy-2-oxoheptanedioate aldolase
MLYRDTADRFLERVREGRVCLGVHSSLMSPQAIELYGFAGLDFVILGAEVESLDYATMENLLRAANASRIVPAVKLRRADPDLVAYCMDLGAPLVAVPHVTSGPQLRELVRATRFGEHGTRGECPVWRYTSYGVVSLEESRRAANNANAVMPIIEDVEAMNNLDDICSVEGVDIIQIGPFDFSLSANAPERGFRSPVVRQAIDKIVETAAKYGKRVMTPLWIVPESSDTYRQIIDWQIEYLVSHGVTLLYQPDLHVLSDHYRSLMPLRSIRVRPEAEAEGETNGATDALPLS